MGQKRENGWSATVLLLLMSEGPDHLQNIGERPARIIEKKGSVMAELREEGNRYKIKKLAALMNLAAENPDVTDEELEVIARSLNRVDAHKLDTAANGCPG